MSLQTDVLPKTPDLPACTVTSSLGAGDLENTPVLPAWTPLNSEIRNKHLVLLT